MPNGGQIIATTANVTLDSSRLKNLPGLNPGAYVMLAIADTGTGMTDKVKAHLFEPFFSTKDQGSGLGLATSYGIIRQSGGSILIETRKLPGVSLTDSVEISKRIERTLQAFPEVADIVIKIGRPESCNSLIVLVKAKNLPCSFL